MKKLLLTLIISTLALCFFAVGVSAASTDAFGTPEILPNINLDGMAEDDDVYCVLFDGEEYHTYPSRYIVTSDATMTWNFEKIESASGIAFSPSSVVRIQVPAHVKTMPCITSTYFSWANVTNLKEVSFPKDTVVTTFVWGAFEKCSGLESIVIPKTVKTFEGVNTFSGCTSLKSVVFEEGSQLTALPDNAFGSTTSLKEIVLPPSITTVGSKPFGGHGGVLSKLVLSPNLSKVTGSGLLNALGRNSTDFIEVYMPACFATAEGSVTSGNIIGRGDKSDLKKYVIFFTGTQDEATAFVEKFAGDISLCDANIVAYDSTKKTAQEYLGMDPYTTDITVNTNRVIVYGYNHCDAFYKGEHTMSGNEQVVLNSYFETIEIGDVCTRTECQKVVVARTIDAIFIDYGYSATEGDINGTFAMSQFYGINQEALEAYKTATGKTFEYGLVAAADSDPITNLENGTLDSKKVFVTNADSIALSCFGMRVCGITEEKSDAKIAFCAYIKDGDKLFYLDDGMTVTSVTMKSYNEIMADIG